LWGERGGSLGACAAATGSAQRRSGRDSPAGADAAAQPTRRTRTAATLRTACHQGSAADDWRDGRAVVSTKDLGRHGLAFSGPAPGLAGGRGGRSGRGPATQRTAGRRSVRPAGRLAARGQAIRARVPRPRERAAETGSAGSAGLAVFGARDGSPAGARQGHQGTGSTRSATARPCGAGGARLVLLCHVHGADPICLYPHARSDSRHGQRHMRRHRTAHLPGSQRRLELGSARTIGA
jgi:hypothetical protein